MCCLRLSEFPPPPPGKTGWPWTEESRQLPDKMPDCALWPRITVVTPSLNQGQFIEEAIRSVLLQGYPNLEYLLLDGGSADNSLEIIRKYSPWLTYWASEPDSGQSEAINRGLQMGSGVYATWINSDDMLCKNALFEHASRIGFAENIVYVGICIFIDAAGKIVSTHRAKVRSFEDLICVKKVWRARGNIVQPEVLFPRKIALRVGGLTSDNYYCMDYELWGKLLLAGTKFHYTEIPIGMARRHKNQKTANSWQTTQALIDTAVQLVNLAEGYSIDTKQNMLAELIAYKKEFWRRTGGLATIGLPPQMLIPFRSLKRKTKSAALDLLRSIKNTI